MLRKLLSYRYVFFFSLAFEYFLLYVTEEYVESTNSRDFTRSPSASQGKDLNSYLFEFMELDLFTSKQHLEMILKMDSFVKEEIGK